MRICHVITRLIIGGAQENTVLTCEGLSQRGHEVTLVSGPTDGPEGSLIARVQAGGYRHVEVADLVRAVRPWRELRARRSLRELFRALRPEVVHTHSSKAGILGRLAARDAGTPAIVHTIHGMSFNRTQPWPVRAAYAALERHCAAFTDRIVTVAGAMIAQSVAAGVCRAEQMETIYSGMEIERFAPTVHDRRRVRAELGVGDEHVVVGTVARLFRRKGYEQLLPIMARAAANNPLLRFVWVGDGAQRGTYERELRRLGLAERTRLTGLVAPEEVARLLAGFDILAHPSQWEGLPRVVVQALLMEVPVVAFDIDGTPEVVLDGQTGRLIGLNRLDEFAAAVIQLASDDGLRRRLGASGREHCVRRFDWREMVARLDALYGRL